MSGDGASNLDTGELSAHDEYLASFSSGGVKQAGEISVLATVDYWDRRGIWHTRWNYWFPEDARGDNEVVECFLFPGPLGGTSLNSPPGLGRASIGGK